MQVLLDTESVGLGAGSCGFFSACFYFIYFTGQGD